MNKRDKFEQYVAFALAKLDHEKPDPVTLVPSRIVAELGEQVNKENVFLCQRSLSWLQDNDFFMATGSPGEHLDEGMAQHTFREARITEHGLASLNVQIRFKGITKRIGDALSDEIREAAKETRGAVIAELVGQLFGGVAKRMLFS